ncbi:MAG: MGMT family protein [Deltaproteobacteria bacterium]|nr:MGMT family protein [Deltaproteobacteria bacterium]
MNKRTVTRVPEASRQLADATRGSGPRKKRGSNVKSRDRPPPVDLFAPRPRPELTPFLKKVRKVIQSIPRGEPISYGEVAFRAGRPGGARAVARALHVLDDVPWWRVCQAGGTFAPQVAHEQENLLRQEGWKPKERRRKAAGHAKTRAPRE